MTNEWWEDIGNDISNDTYLETFIIIDGALNDEKILEDCRGLCEAGAAS